MLGPQLAHGRGVAAVPCEATAEKRLRGGRQMHHSRRSLEVGGLDSVQIRPRGAAAEPPVVLLEDLLKGQVV